MGKLKFDHKLCTGCRSCQSACLDKHYEDVQATVACLIKMKKYIDPDTGFEKNVASACRHCEDAACMSICPTNAIYKDEQNYVLIDTENCIGCISCANACPYGAIIVFNNKPIKCDGCKELREQGKTPACAANCPYEAVIQES